MHSNQEECIDKQKALAHLTSLETGLRSVAIKLNGDYNVGHLSEVLQSLEPFVGALKDDLRPKLVNSTKSVERKHAHLISAGTAVYFSDEEYALRKRFSKALENLSKIRKSVKERGINLGLVQHRGNIEKASSQKVLDVIDKVDISVLAEMKTYFNVQAKESKVDVRVIQKALNPSNKSHEIMSKLVKELAITRVRGTVQFSYLVKQYLVAYCKTMFNLDTTITNSTIIKYSQKLLVMLFGKA